MSATIFENDLDTGGIEQLDFEHEEPCDTDECDAPAEWELRTACCGFVTFVCEDCLIGAKRTLSMFPNKDIICRMCDKRVRCTPDWLIVIGRIKE